MKIKIKYNSLLAKTLLFAGYAAIMLFGTVYVKYSWMPISAEKHETIHAKQWIECMILWAPISVSLTLVGVFVWDSYWHLLHLIEPLIAFYVYFYFVEYVISFVVNLFRGKGVKGSNDSAYHASAMEMEAVSYEKKSWDEVDNRKWFGFFKFYGTV